MEHATFALVNEDDETPAPHSRASHEADIHAWAMQQADFIRLHRFGELDIENLADEIEDMARRVRKELVSRLGLVVTRPLKWDHQPGRRSASGARTIRERRPRIDEVLVEAPTLRSRLPGLFEEAFEQGRVAALNETGLDDADIPEANPFTWDDLMRRPVLRPER